MAMVRIRNTKTNRVSEVPQVGVGRVTIGRADANTIRLEGGTVSSQHAEVQVYTDHIIIRDLGSSNGTYVYRRRIVPERGYRVKFRTPIDIGPYELMFMDGTEESDMDSSFRTISGTREVGPTRDEDRLDEFKRDVQHKLRERLDLRRLEAEGVSNEEMKNRAVQALRDIIDEVTAQLPSGVTKRVVTDEIMDEAFGLGPLEDLLRDESVTEIMVNGRDRIYVERDGRLYLTEKRFTSEDHLLLAIERIVAKMGRRIDELQPYVDARLDDGSRVNAIIRPLSIQGASLTIRKFPETRYTMQDLLDFGALSPKMAEFLRVAVVQRCNVVISGGTGSGKTTFLNILAGFIPPGERVVTIEDTHELNLPHENMVCLEARPRNIEGKGEVTIRDLVRNSLRMRPDRIVVGECRGGEAIDMLQAMNTGHDGSLTTLHANSPRHAVGRLTTMCLMSDLGLPAESIREHIGSAVHLIVHQDRFADGSRKIANISEIRGHEHGEVLVQDLFAYRQQGFDDQGRVRGVFEYTGKTPLLFEQMREKMLDVPDLQDEG